MPVLIDEESGRSLARQEGLEVRGTVGILENLYERREISDLREGFRRLGVHNAHLRVDLLNRRLTRLGLSPL